MTDKKLIPFDLERALAGDSVISRDGKKVIQIVNFPIMLPFNKKVIAYLENESKLYCYTDDGFFFMIKKNQIMIYSWFQR
jgi:hypothetical protein